MLGTLEGRLARLLAAAAMALIAPAAVAGDHVPVPSPKDARVYFHYPLDGSSTSQRFTVRIGLKEMGVAPAGVNKAGTGHHHLLVDVDLPPLDRPIPNDYNHIHLGAGQTEVVLTLPPGRHTLQLLLGDHDHAPHSPPVMSRKITIHVR